MSDSEINVKLAEALGWKRDDQGYWRNAQGHFGQNQSWAHGVNTVPNYTGSYDAVMPHIMGLPDTGVFIKNLATVMGYRRCIFPSDITLTSTPRQLALALLATLSGG